MTMIHQGMEWLMVLPPPFEIAPSYYLNNFLINSSHPEPSLVDAIFYGCLILQIWHYKLFISSWDIPR
uniref:Uncharacterized protein n=1 Tax=Glycine max TaxID=3847 RepID=C6TKR3_SOYBN|nr:unknown [Glycine max]